MATKEDITRRRDIVLRYLGDKDRWVNYEDAEVDTLVTTRSLQSVLNWMEDHEMVHQRMTKGKQQYRLSAFGREIYNLRMSAMGAVTAI
jgi:hypothetical protein